MSALQLLDDMIFELESALAVTNTIAGNIGNGTTPAAGQPEPSDNQKKSKKVEKNKVPGSSDNSGKSTAVAAVKTSEGVNINSIDLRVGVIVSVKRHETADKLYCEEIDCGEGEPRAIASGLVPHYTLEEMQGRRLLVLCNLKPRNLVGFKSHGMVLCAVKTNEDGQEKVEFVDPPVDARPGDRIVGHGLAVSDPLSASQCDKQKAFEVVAAGLTVNGDGVAMWNGHPLVTLSGQQQCTAPTVRDGIMR